MSAPSAHQFLVVEGGHGPIGNQYDPTQGGCSCGWRSGYLSSTRPNAFDLWMVSHIAVVGRDDLPARMAWDEAHADHGQEGPL